MVRSPTTCPAAAVALVLLAAGCGGGPKEAPAADQRARGLEIVNQTGRHIAAAQSFSFNSHWEGTRVRRSGEKVPVMVDQVVKVRRPDRLFLKSTGDLDLEAYYDGKQVTLVTPSAKVYGVVPAAGTINEMVAETVDRYDIPFPLGDIISFIDAESLVSDATTGGYVGEETIDGQETSKVAWQHPNLDWTLWVTKGDEPVPVRLYLLYKGRKGQPERTYEFSNWRFDANLEKGDFDAHVPADYEGIAVLQRESAVLSEDDATAPAGDAGKEK